MKTKRAIPLLRPFPIIGLGILASCATPGGTSRTPVAYRGDSSLPGVVHDDINEIRGSKGVRALTRHAGMDKLAMEHSEYMRKNRGSFNLYGKNVSHMGAEGRAMLTINGFQMMSYSENVAWAVKQPDNASASRALIALWKDSPAHRDAIYHKEWTHTGIGVVKDDDGSVFATQIFATKNMSHTAMRDRFNEF